jgi:hydrogenase nickel incorporation protein HypA/HybF
MHELSIAMSIVELAEEEAGRRGDAQVHAVHLKLGAFSGVVKEALLASYEMACAGTALEGSTLRIEEIPLVVFCANCQTNRQLPSMTLFCCPDCGAPTPHIVQGKELQISALEITQLEPRP